MISSIFIHFIHWSHQSRAPANRLNESASFWILENFIYRVDSFEFIETVVGTISGTFHWNSREITWLSWGVNWTLEYANRGLNKVVIGWLIRWFSPISRHLGSTINVNFAVERSAVIGWVVWSVALKMNERNNFVVYDGRWCMQIEPTFNWQDDQTN